MKINASELIGPALDWAVAKCEGATEGYNSLGVFLWDGIPCINAYGHDVDFTPSTNWSHGGPIIEREGISVAFVLGWVSHPMGPWRATPRLSEQYNYYTLGAAQCETPLIAAMRCYVASKLGDEVEIPEELLS